MAETGSSDAAEVRILPPLVPLATVLAGIALQILIPLPRGPMGAGRVHVWIGGLILASAITLAIWAVATMQRTGQSPNPHSPTPSIIESGPYRISRNPMYLQLVLATLGLAILLGNLWLLILTPVCAWVLLHYAILPEEDYLQRKFGEPYLAYCRRVRRWL
jgi:protein-S-isoprenylcysteine O-methyltransferase Ste14